jgi:hypothetical protein
MVRMKDQKPGFCRFAYAASLAEKPGLSQSERISGEERWLTPTLYKI